MRVRERAVGGACVWSAAAAAAAATPPPSTVTKQTKTKKKQINKNNQNKGAKLCIIMEYAQAGDLQGVIGAASRARAPLPERDVWLIVLQLAQALHVRRCVVS